VFPHHPRAAAVRVGAILSFVSSSSRDGRTSGGAARPSAARKSTRAHRTRACATCVPHPRLSSASLLVSRSPHPVLRGREEAEAARAAAATVATRLESGRRGGRTQQHSRNVTACERCSTDIESAASQRERLRECSRLLKCEQLLVCDAARPGRRVARMRLALPRRVHAAASELRGQGECGQRYAFNLPATSAHRPTTPTRLLTDKA